MLFLPIPAIIGRAAPAPLSDLFLASQIGTVSGNNIDFTTVSGLTEADPRRTIICVAGTNAGSAVKHTALKLSGGAGGALSNIAGYGTSAGVANKNYISAWVASWGGGAGSTFPTPQLQCDAAPGLGWIDFYQCGRPGTPTSVIYNSSASANSLSLNIDVPAGGMVIAFSQTTTAANSVTWTGATENSDGLVSGSTYRSSAWYINTGAAETGRLITADWAVDPSSNIRLAALALGAPL